MVVQPINLLSFYKGWDVYQTLLIKALEPLSSDQLGLRAAPHLRSVRSATSTVSWQGPFWK